MVSVIHGGKAGEGGLRISLMQSKIIIADELVV